MTAHGNALALAVFGVGLVPTLFSFSPGTLRRSVLFGLFVHLILAGSALYMALLNPDLVSFRTSLLVLAAVLVAQYWLLIVFIVVFERRVGRAPVIGRSRYLHRTKEDAVAGAFWYALMLIPAAGMVPIVPY